MEVKDCLEKFIVVGDFNEWSLNNGVVRLENSYTGHGTILHRATVLMARTGGKEKSEPGKFVSLSFQILGAKKLWAQRLHPPRKHTEKASEDEWSERTILFPKNSGAIAACLETGNSGHGLNFHIVEPLGTCVTICLEFQTDRAEMACACDDCNFLVHSSLAMGGYCCGACAGEEKAVQGIRHRAYKVHSRNCQRRIAESISRQGDKNWKPLDNCPYTVVARLWYERNSPADGKEYPKVYDATALDRNRLHLALKLRGELTYIDKPDAAKTIEPVANPIAAAEETESTKELCDIRWRDQLSKETLSKVDELQSLHASSPAHARRPYSWARTLAFSRVVLRVNTPEPLRQCCATSPFVIWVLQATNDVELHLADGGYFSDVSWIDDTPTDIYLWGKKLRTVNSVSVQKDGSPRIWVKSYAEMGASMAERPPDMVAVIHPHSEPEGQNISLRELPESVFGFLATTPSVIISRFCLHRVLVDELSSTLSEQLLLPMTRCPFSSTAGAPGVSFDENGWFFIVKGPSALRTTLGKLSNSSAAQGSDVSISPPMPRQQHAQLEGGYASAASERMPALFWGILDLKYDTNQPLLSRVKVLETGDGATSKFSFDGEHIHNRFQENYQKITSGPAATKYRVVSTDKKLTHDLMEDIGFEHIMPKQVCCLREYDVKLADKILTGLELHEKSDLVVLKLCNRSRGAGVIVVKAEQLDEMLWSLLKPRKDLDKWLQDCVWRCKKADSDEPEKAFVDLGVKGNEEEQVRHWWCNEAPCFVAERYATSVSIERNGSFYDCCLRVSFVLRLREAAEQQSSTLESMPPPEDLVVDWLGGYWKLPESDLEGKSLRSRCVSAVGVAGTAPVDPAHLHEVYATLGDAMLHLFGGPEPSPEHLMELSKGQMEFAAFLIARLSLSSMDDPEHLNHRLAHAEHVLGLAKKSPARDHVESYLSRARGMCEIKPHGKVADRDVWRRAQPYLERSLESNPCNANALFWLGMARLESDRLDDAIRLMYRSLLLDQDFKGPYVNLGVAFLREKNFAKVREISKRCLARFPDSPQCHYHIAVSWYQEAWQLFWNADLSGMDPRGAMGKRKELCAMLEASLENLRLAREHNMAKSRTPKKLQGARISPWLQADDLMYSETRSFLSVVDSVAWPEILQVELPENVGWRFLNWRT